eukprot:441569-Alexandrium_andersonii.AAC.1
MATPPIVQCLLKGAVIKKEPMEELGPASPANSKATAPSPPPTPRQPFSSNKARYNKFNYKLRLVPADLRQQWHVIRSQEVTNPEAFDTYVNSVINYETKDTLQKKRTIANIKEHSTATGWISWKEAEEKEGYEVLMAQ